jgi:hypothetical protein
VTFSCFLTFLVEAALTLAVLDTTPSPEEVAP